MRSGIIRTFFLLGMTAGSATISAGEPLLAQADVTGGPVGQAPPERQPAQPEVHAIPELGGVLTPKGRFVIEPSLVLSTSQVNRFTFLGVEILETFLIGLLEAEDADRDVISAALTTRYGITDRLEIEAKIPFIYREDTLTATIPQAQTQQGQPVEVTDELSGDGLGDIELSLHYQLNRGQNGWPFFVGNLRYKSDTGEGPFEVGRNSLGRETDLPTGSGFHAIEPSLTMLYPTDPAVLFANIGYVFNMSDDIDEAFPNPSDPNTQVTVGKVEPGDVFRFSFGMAYAVNPRTSFTLGYKHDFIQKTDTEFLTETANGINRTRVTSSNLQIGSLLLGFGMQFTQRVGANLNLELGVTDDAPDVVLTLRVPLAF